MTGGRKIRGREKTAAGSPVLSLFALYSRSSLYKVLAVLAGLAIAELLSFFAVCRGLEQDGQAPCPEKMIDMCFLKYIFLAAFILVYFILFLTEGERGGCRSSYTLLRLKVSEKGQFAVRVVYNFLCMTMVFAVQILAAVTICRLYEAKLPPELVSPQYLFLAFYRNSFLHSILPMADFGWWACVFTLILALAMDAARGSGFFRERKAAGRGGNVSAGRGLLSSVTLCVILAYWFVSEYDPIDTGFCMLYCLMIIGVALFKLFGMTGGGINEEA